MNGGLRKAGGMTASCFSIASRKRTTRSRRAGRFGRYEHKTRTRFGQRWAWRRLASPLTTSDLGTRGRTTILADADLETGSFCDRSRSGASGSEQAQHPPVRKADEDRDETGDRQSRTEDRALPVAECLAPSRITSDQVLETLVRQDPAVRHH